MTTVLVTAGPTREYLDEVRFLSNGSTGRMGYALARAARRAGHRALLVTGPTALPSPPDVEVHAVESALEMASMVDELLPAADLVYGAAAVSDFRPAERRAGKPPKPAGDVVLTLVPNPDIIAGVGERKGDRIVIGFALEAVTPGGLDEALVRGRDKLVRKQLDAIAVNLSTALAADDSEVVLLLADGTEHRLPRQSKDATADELVRVGLELWQRKQTHQ